MIIASGFKSSGISYHVGGITDLSRFTPTPMRSSFAGLAGALLAVVEETDKNDTLDEAGMK